MVPAFEVMQVPPTVIHPPVSTIPLANVEDAVADVMLSCVADNPPAKVDVPCPAPTVIAAAKVEVAVVEVAKTELKNPCAADICVVDAPAEKVASPLKVSAVDVALPMNG